MSNWKGFSLIVLSVVLAAVAGGLAYVYLQRMPVKTEEVAPTAMVVVASEDMTFGTKLEPQHLGTLELPVDAVPEGTYSHPDSVVGFTTKIFLKKGEMVFASKLSDLGGGLSVRIPESMRATSVTVNEVSGVSGFVLPGDRVDALVTIDNAKGPGNAVTKTILQNVEVLAAGVKTQTRNNNPVQVQTVTLQVDPEGAERLALGMHQGKVHLVLRNPADYEIAEINPTNTKEMMGLVTKRKWTPRPKPKPEPTPEPAPVVVIEEPASYTIIRSGKVKKEEFPNEPPNKGSGGSDDDGS